MEIEKRTKIICPINFTHSADIDGIGCSILSKIVFNNSYVNEGEAFFAEPLIIPLSAKSEQMESVVKERITCENLTGFTEACIGITGYSLDEYESDDLEFVLIISDIYMQDDLQKYITDTIKICYPDSAIDIWIIDHHKTHPYFNQMVYEYNEDEHYLPNKIIICTNYPNSGFPYKVDEINIKYDREYLSELFNECDGFIDTYANDTYKLVNETNAERSATYLYFKILKDMSLLNDLSPNVFLNLVKTVYHITNYDTFEFDKMEPCLPVVHDYPDALTLLWKSYRGDFFGFFNMLYKGILSIFPNNKYNELPNIADSEIDKLKFLYENREKEFHSVERSLKVVKYGDIKKCLNISYDEITDDCDVAVIIKDITDVSYIGNTLVKRYPSIKIAMIIFTESRTVSFRSNNKDDSAPDVSIIAKEIGGGGHKYASGTILEQDKMINILSLFWSMNKTNISDYQ